MVSAGVFESWSSSILVGLWRSSSLFALLILTVADTFLRRNKPRSPPESQPHDDDATDARSDDKEKKPFIRRCMGRNEWLSSLVPLDNGSFRVLVKGVASLVVLRGACGSRNRSDPSWWSMVVVSVMILRRWMTPWIVSLWIQALQHFQNWCLGSPQQQGRLRHHDNKDHNKSWFHSTLQSVVSTLIQGGPLGKGCSKLVDVVVGLVLWNVVATHHHLIRSRDSNPPPTNTIDLASVLALYHCRPHWWNHHNGVATAGLEWNQAEEPFTSSMDSSLYSVPLVVVTWWQLLGGLLLLCAVVNLVLWTWSTLQQRQRQPSTTPSHAGVQRMVQSTVGRRLTPTEHCQMALWAVANAVCEEVESRGLQRVEFQSLLLLLLQFPESSQPRLVGSSLWDICTNASNLWQAAVFGLWHYHGIPSGWTGVGLTWVYGWIMGLLTYVTVVVPSLEGSSSSSPPPTTTATPSRGGCRLWFPMLAHAVADYYIFASIARQQQRRQQQRSPPS